MKRRICLSSVFLFCAAVSLPLSADSASVEALNRAIGALGAAEYRDAAFFADQAAQYDPLMADARYVKALAGIGAGNIKAGIIASLEDSFTCPRWIFYNREAARGVYALLLCDVGRFDEALAAAPPDTADGSLASVRAYYGKHKWYDARTLLKNALERFPFDSRFCETFFDNEKDTVRAASAGDVTSAAVTALRDDVLARLDLFDTADSQLLMKAIPFVTDREKIVRMVSACRAAGYREPDGIFYALKYGVIDDVAAVHELGAASSRAAVEFSLLQDILALLQSADAVQNVSSWLYLFEGTVKDSRYGGLTVAFNRGRPVSATYDKNNDGIADFVASFNNGVPETIGLPGFGADGATVTYGTYPYIAKAVAGDTEYLFAPRALSWSPLVVDCLTLQPVNMLFFMPRPDNSAGLLYTDALYKNCSFLRRPVTERDGAVEQLELVHGIPVSSVRTVDRIPYSLGRYRDGRLESRSIDIDGDGSFEGVELYESRPGDEQPRLAEFFIDRNRNNCPEYKEVYGENTFYMWDTDDDGIVDIEYRVLHDGRTCTVYRNPVTRQNIEIISYEQKPLSVSADGNNIPIQQGAADGFFWIRALPATPDNALAELEEKIKAAYFETFDGSNVCIIAVGDKKYQTAFSGGLFFAEVQE